MSEYQYYEFRAIDRSLTKEEMAEVRRTSTRAEITPTSFVNVYHWGDYHGDPLELMTRFYDAHVYTANWGTHQLMFGFPRRLLDPAIIKPYFVTDAARLHEKGDRVVLEFILSPEDGGGYWSEEDDDWLDRLVGLRADLAQGDFRALYLAWLFGVQEDFGFGYVSEDGDVAYAYEEDDEVSNYLPEVAEEGVSDPDGTGVEPSVPAGLGQLTEPLKALVEFLQIDPDLLAVAAERSPELTSTKPSAADVDAWLKSLPVAAKDAIIFRLLSGEGPGLRLELLRRYSEATAVKPVAEKPRRKVGELLSAARVHAEERKRKEAERAAKENARKEREAAAARSAYLDNLASREGATWTQIESLIDAKQAKPYDQATQLLVDLRELAAGGKSSSFSSRLADLRTRHAKKTAFIERLNKAGLR